MLIWSINQPEKTRRVFTRYGPYCTLDQATTTYLPSRN